MADPIPPPDPTPPRRTDLPLPPYRFVAGLHPHPLSPEGHGAEVPDDPELAFAYACDLFDQRFWWEAHEAWEGLWNRAGRISPEARLYQGLLQLSAALFKDHVGATRGAQTLFERGEGHLNALPPSAARGIDLPVLIARVRAALQGGPPPLLPALPPAGYPI